MAKLDWEKAKAREGLRKKKRKRKKEVVGVHPNSTAAKKWGRTKWFRYPAE